MTEKPEIAEAGAEPGVDPAAMALALGAASRERADTFLEEHTRLVRLQAEELSHELDVRRWVLWVRHLSGLLKLTFEIGLAVVGLGIACFIAAAIWNAAHAEGLVIESFSVPPDMAARGLTGQVMASKTLDQLTAMVGNTDTYRAAKSYANNWGDDIKVEIPETGVSIGEAYRFLKNWLGHETHISGEVVRTATGIAITARTGGGGSITTSGNESDLDSLIRSTAEHVYGSTQPYRYALYLTRRGRENEAAPVLQTLIATGSEQERPWGYVGLANTISAMTPGRDILLRRGLALQPDNLLFLQILSASLGFQSRHEEALALDRRSQAIFREGGGGDLISANRLPAMQKAAEARIAMAMGDFPKAAQDQADSIALGALPRLQRLTNLKVLAETGAHDLSAARATMANPGEVQTSPGFGAPPVFFVLADIATRMQVDVEAEDWTAVRSRAGALDPLLAKEPRLQSALLTMTAPLLAFAQARLGDFAAAERSIAPTPAHCYPCLRARARIAALQRQDTRSDFWFARAAAAGPSLPFAHSEWGKAMLERGDPDGAIAKFTIARQKGPKFGDPLVYWGEALMAKNQSHRALAKFKQAEPFAPNWGRLHLKWGEALVYAGRRDEAKMQLARATQLYLTPAEKAELAGLRYN